jgi:tetratricopeptide (TPR) repeat protein
MDLIIISLIYLVEQHINLENSNSSFEIRRQFGMPNANFSSYQVRIFISSTFRDMQAERNWLVKRVFPALRQRLEPYHIYVIDIDLRWGITREQADNDLVLSLCLRQIDESRPFFLGLLGGRYGWVPSDFPVEVGKRYGWTQHYTGKSLTELEIIHGVLNDPTMHERALFCFRSEHFLDDISDPIQRQVFIEGPTYEELEQFGTEEATRRAAKRHQNLIDLKRRIRELSKKYNIPLFENYPCVWDGELADPVTKKPGQISGLVDFGNWVLNNLERTILEAPELQKHLSAFRINADDELADERNFQEHFIESRTRTYIGRQVLQNKLGSFIYSDETPNCLLTGRSGIGKSAALARFVSTWRKQHPQDVIIGHFIGASPRSTSLQGMLWHLCSEIKDYLKLAIEIKQNTGELADQLSKLLAETSTNNHIILIIDALDQLDETDDLYSLKWLPKQSSPKLKLIISCIDDPDRPNHRLLSALRNLQPYEIVIDPLTNQERLDIVRDIPSIAAKTLDVDQIALVLENEATRNPLFLLVALEELRGFGSFEQISQKIEALPRKGDTLMAIFQQVFRRLGEDFKASTVKDVLTLISCARYGLSERELLDLIEGENVLINESMGDLFPILRQLRPFLQTRGALIDFFHRHLDMATKEEYFKENSALYVNVHRRIADYFSRQPLVFDAGPGNSGADHLYNLRKVTEQAWQYRQAIEHSSNPEESNFIWELLFKTITDLEWGRASILGGFAEELVDDYHFLYAFAKDYNKNDDAAKMALALLSLMNAAQENSGKPALSIENVHAWIVYRGDKRLLEELLKAALNGEPPQKGSKDSQFYAKRSIRWGNVLRRDGDLNAAEALLNNALILLDPGSSYSLSEQSTAEYEIGYIHFLRGDFAQAMDYFARSTAHAKESGNPVGASISQCLEWEMRFFSDPGNAEEFRRILNETRKVFEAEAKVKPDASRWVMNVKAHNFDIAVLTGDIEQAKIWFGELERDPWICNPKLHSETLDFIRRGRFALAQKRFNDAAENFNKYLKKEPGRGARSEQAARVYLDLGRALDGMGEREKAIAAWQEGLKICEDDCGNRFWKERIRSELGPTAA